MPRDFTDGASRFMTKHDGAGGDFIRDHAAEIARQGRIVIA